MPAFDDLRTKLHDADRAPFLFVGAGMSKRYLKLDNWIDLLGRMAALTSNPYAYYATKANNNLPAVATLIAQDFHEIWWSDAAYKSSRTEFANELSTIDGPLKVEIAKYTRGALSGIPKSGTLIGDELEALSCVAIDGAITTNYDGLLEHIFPEFQTYIGQDQLLFSGTQGIAEIYKIHGSCTAPESMILTRADYERFGERNPYLAAKLLTIFVEHPVFFLGYSLNDPNVTEILTSVARVLTTQNLARLQDHLFFVNWDKSVKNPTLVNTQIAVAGFTIPVMQLRIPDFISLFLLLGEVPRKFPAQLLRQLKQHVYDLVASTAAPQQLAVVDINDTTLAKDIDVVFGVGVRKQLAERGYQGLTRQDLLHDVLRGESEYDPVRVVHESLPNIMRVRAFTPLYRYLKDASLLTEKGKLIAGEKLSLKIQSRVASTKADLSLGKQQKKRAQKLVAAAGGDLSALLAKKPLADALLAVLEYPRAELDTSTLRDFLLQNVDAFSVTSTASAWAKAVYLYDYLKFGDGATASSSKGSL